MNLQYSRANIRQNKSSAGAEPCGQVIQRSPKTACGSGEALPLMRPQSWPSHSGGSSISSTARNDLSEAGRCKIKCAHRIMKIIFQM